MTVLAATPGTERSSYWDMVKGLGIIAIVLGHSRSPLKPYVNLYHLTLFFFVSGFLYKEKYSSEPCRYFLSRLKRLWLPWAKYGLLFVALHNILLYLGFYSDKAGIPGIRQMQPYGPSELLKAAKGVVLMLTMEQVGGAMWFILPLFVGMIIFCLIKWASLLAGGWKRQALVFALVSVCGLIGLSLVGRNATLVYHANVALLVLPIIFGGSLARRYWGHVPMKWYYGVFSAVILVLVYKMTGKVQNLGGNDILPPGLFFLVSFSGIYTNLYLSSLIGAWAGSAALLAYIGRNSFHIMALHLLVFKFVNSYRVLIDNGPIFMIARFPSISGPGWWIIYTIAGLAVPVALVEAYDRLRGKLLQPVPQEKGRRAEAADLNERA